jgi:hypothetical protein
VSRVEIVPFDVAHVGRLANHGGQEKLVAQVSSADLDLLVSRGRAWSAIRDDDVIACAGFIAANQYRATAWALFAGGSPRDFVAVHHATIEALDSAPYRIIEAYVDPKSVPAMRWIRLLRFKLRRAYLPFFFPDGSGASEWVYQPRGLVDVSNHP